MNLLLLMLVINCSASGGAITIRACSLRSSFVTAIVFYVVIFCCSCGELFQYIRSATSICLRQTFSWLDSFFLEWWKDFDVDLFRFFRCLFAISAYLNFVSVSINTSWLIGSWGSVSCCWFVWGKKSLHPDILEKKIDLFSVKICCCCLEFLIDFEINFFISKWNTNINWQQPSFKKRHFFVFFSLGVAALFA